MQISLQGFIYEVFFNYILIIIQMPYPIFQNNMIDYRILFELPKQEKKLNIIY